MITAEKLTLLLSITILTASCNSEGSSSAKPAQKSDSVVISQTKELPDAGPSEPGKEISYYPGDVDTALPATILEEGGFHSDEVPDDAAKKNWIGLFKKENSYYLSPTRINTTREFDLVVDEDSTKEKTGWMVKPLHEDSCMLLITGLSQPLNNRTVEAIPLSGNTIFPEDSMVFTFKAVKYTLFATGNIVYNVGYKTSQNYRLYLRAIKNGKQITQLLASSPAFEDNMITIQFAGDIDGDGLPDFLIDTSNHYNVTKLTLYLSGSATEGKLLLLTGMHTSVGC